MIFELIRQYADALRAILLIHYIKYFTKAAEREEMKPLGGRLIKCLKPLHLRKKARSIKVNRLAV